MGLFAEWQPQYAEVAVPIFPVVGKRPAVKGYLKVGLNASRDLATKFGDASAFGIPLRRSKIVVLDVDTPDENVLADAMGRCGSSPFIVRSGSGHWQAWYRGSGEGRRVRPDPSVPVDILGAGFAVGPPSEGAKGAYTIIDGSLADLRNLPVMVPQEWSKSTTNTYTPPPALGGLEGIGPGARNSSLWRYLMMQARFCDDADALVDVARTAAAAFETALADDEVVKTALSAWRYEAEDKNWVGLGGRPPVPASEPEGLLWCSPDAFILWKLLRHHNVDRGKFHVANAMAETMPGGGWARKRFAEARKVLLDEGHITLVRAASMKAGAAVYAWGRLQ